MTDIPRIAFFEQRGDWAKRPFFKVPIKLPPVAVFPRVGFGKHFWINIVLTILGFIPGLVHAVWIIAKDK
jgi:uncharacterized membrane protein YqaE (UPF0057 family)